MIPRQAFNTPFLNQDDSDHAQDKNPYLAIVKQWKM